MPYLVRAERTIWARWIRSCNRSAFYCLLIATAGSICAAQAPAASTPRPPPPLAPALAAGAPTAIDYRPSFVDGIGGRGILAEMWPLASTLLAGSFVVGLEEIAAAIRILVTRARVVAEGAGAASLAAAFAGRPATGAAERPCPAQEGPLVCVVSGGNLRSGAAGDDPRGPPALTQLQLGGGLMDLVHDDRVAGSNEIVLKPAVGDAGGHDDHVPGGRLRCCFSFPVHLSHRKRFPQDRLRDGSDAQRLARASTRHNPECLAFSGAPPQLVAVLPLQQGLGPGTNASSIVSHAARVGAITMIRPSGERGGKRGIGRKMVVAGGVHVGG